MPPVQLEFETRYGPVVAVASHLAVAVYLTVQAGRSLHLAYQSLGPSQETRGRATRRNTLLPVFAGLAVISLLRTAYGTVDYGVLSYKVWASGRNIELPTGFYGSKGIFPLGENATPIYPVQWLSDTPIYLDAIQIIAEKARRFWWGQQANLGLLSWSMFVAIEGRRRNIPFLWCYQLLGQLVSLAFAQNLFFMAILLTPIPLHVDTDTSLHVSRCSQLRNMAFPPKPANWAPHASVFYILTALNCASILTIPCQFGAEHIGWLVIAFQALTMAPLVVQYVLPLSWGNTHQDRHEVYGTYEKLFKAISLASFVLHARASFVGLLYNAPEAHYHRHSVYLPFDIEQRSAWERTTSAFGRILEATSDHPVVGTTGWDVILTGISLGFWVATRAMNVSDIFASTIPGFTDQRQSMACQTTEPEIVTRGKAKAPMAGSDEMGAGTGPGEEETAAASVRRRGKPRKITNEPDDSTYEPTPSELAATEEGDELPNNELDWESAAVVWGLTALGGLGVGSAGAYGSEILAV